MLSSHILEDPGISVLPKSVGDRANKCVKNPSSVPYFLVALIGPPILKNAMRGWLLDVELELLPANRTSLGRHELLDVHVCMAQIARNLTVSLPFYISGDEDYCTTVQQLLQTTHVHSRLPLQVRSHQITSLESPTPSPVIRLRF
jgi:hypothetical protein